MNTIERLSVALAYFIVGSSLGLAITVVIIGYWIGVLQ